MVGPGSTSLSLIEFRGQFYLRRHNWWWKGVAATLWWYNVGGAKIDGGRWKEQWSFEKKIWRGKKE